MELYGPDFPLLFQTMLQHFQKGETVYLNRASIVCCQMAHPDPDAVLLHLGFHDEDPATADENFSAPIFNSDGDMIYEPDPDLDGICCKTDHFGNSKAKLKANFHMMDIIVKTK
jgi:hypothetical protein